MFKLDLAIIIFHKRFDTKMNDKHDCFSIILSLMVMVMSHWSAHFSKVQYACAYIDRSGFEERDIFIT